MATIFEKIPGEQCLILGSREAFIYPFDVGSWSEIRVSWYGSMTTAASNNATVSNETLAFSSSYKNSVYYGIKDSGSALPSQPGSTFVGFGQMLGYALTTTLDVSRGLVPGDVRFDNMGHFYAGRMVSHGGSAWIRYTEDSSIPVSNCAPFRLSAAEMTGATNYAGFYSMKFVKDQDANGKNRITMSTSYAAPNEAYTVANLRTRALSATYLYIISGMLTTHQNTTGTNVDIPNSIFFYLPLTQRMRFHAIVVEKMS